MLIAIDVINPGNAWPKFGLGLYEGLQGKERRTRGEQCHKCATLPFASQVQMTLMQLWSPLQANLKIKTIHELDNWSLRAKHIAVVCKGSEQKKSFAILFSHH